MRLASCTLLTFVHVHAAMPKRVTNPKIACLDMGLMKSKMKMGVQVVVTEPSQLEAIHKRYTFALHSLAIL